MSADLGFIYNRPPATGRTSFTAPQRKVLPSVIPVSPRGPAGDDLPPLDATMPAIGLAAPDMRQLRSDPMLSRRTDFLEAQVKMIKSTLDQTRTDSTQIKEALHTEYAGVKDIYNEMQWVYGRAGDAGLVGIPCGEDTRAALTACAGDLDVVAAPDEWVMLTYPMERVALANDHHRVLMRAKRVDPHTGQMAYVWCVVYEQKGGAEVRHVTAFSLRP